MEVSVTWRILCSLMPLDVVPMVVLANSVNSVNSISLINCDFTRRTCLLGDRPTLGMLLV